MVLINRQRLLDSLSPLKTKHPPKGCSFALKELDGIPFSSSALWIDQTTLARARKVYKGALGSFDMVFGRLEPDTLVDVFILEIDVNEIFEGINEALNSKLK